MTGWPSEPSINNASETIADDNSASLSLPERARHILRHVADSVVVCTAHSQSTMSATPGAIAIPVGLTMSSFAPLSLSPSPVITFNIAVPSRTERVIARTRHFMIHVLSGDVHGARLADVFRAGNAQPANTLRALQSSGSQVFWPQKTPGLHEDHEQPFLRGAGVLYVLRCRLLDEPLKGLVPVRDHVVVLGEILEILGGEADAVDSGGAPRFGLIYGDRHYRQLGSAVLYTESED